MTFRDVQVGLTCCPLRWMLGVADETANTQKHRVSNHG
eukprot:CAMPEP_0183586768 /NCGR_PEP_ID=MMETSP0371-20130417/157763_1 /TAXON_ID=268820 /ORGANISM="Peridinium aciculiferum, Strain PAER-2" /LENGTH=37 /DNA_ID= /DNA_START= /DNA_END= /DNA_ORIENTATION=